MIGIEDEISSKEKKRYLHIVQVYFDQFEPNLNLKRIIKAASNLKQALGKNKKKLGLNFKPLTLSFNFIKINRFNFYWTLVIGLKAGTANH